MILESVIHGPLIWHMVEENGVIKTKKYVELSAAEKIQADCDMKATNIILQGLPADIYSLVNHHRTEDLDTYDSDCDDLSNAQAVLMANISNYGSDVILERIKPTLYDGIVISEKHVAMTVIDDEETLILEEERRSKMSKKAKDLEVITKKISHKPIDYETLNRVTGDFGKCFTPQQELVEVPSGLPKRSESFAKCLNLDVEFSKSKQAYNDLLRKYSQLKKHCISLKVSMQLKQEVFQNNESCVYQNAPEIPKYFKKIDLKAQLKDKGMTIFKLKDTIKSLRKNNKEEIFDHDRCDLATINEELKNSMEKLLSENERCKEINHVKQVFKDQFDSIKQTRVLQKKQSDSLINKLNLKSAVNEDLKAQIQDKVFVITSLKNNLRKLKGKSTIDNAAQIPYATTVASGMFKLDLEPLAPKLVHTRESHRVKCSTSASGSKPSGNTKNNRIPQPSSSNKINKVNDQPMNVKTRKNNKRRVKKVKCDESMSNANSESVSINNAPVKNYVNDVKSGCLCAICSKCMFVEIHHAFTSTNVVPPKQTTSHSVEIQKQDIKVYSRKPKKVKNIGSSKMAMIVESKNANHSEPNHTWGSIATDIPSPSFLVMIGIVRFWNDQIARIIGYGEYQQGNIIISRKNTCFIRNLEGVDLLSGSRDINLNTISLDDMLKSSPVCLLSKVSKTKSWLWHRQLSHLNFACALGKSKISSHQPKAEDTNQEKLFLLHMDLCGPVQDKKITTFAIPYGFIGYKDLDSRLRARIIPLGDQERLMAMMKTHFAFSHKKQTLSPKNHKSKTQDFKNF
nr:hypothetical protein [Tanacetum cinerariifolium]